MYILDKIDNGSYLSKDRMPTEYDFTRFWAYKKGTIIPLYVSREEYNTWLNSANRGPVATVEKIVDKKAYKSALEAHRKIEDELRDKFRDDALRETDLEHLCTKNEIFQYAWDESHSEGLRSVYYTLLDLADLFEGLVNKEEQS